MIFKKTNVLRIANIVRQNIQKKRLLNSYHSLLLTFSGGQDSAFCLLLLYLLQIQIKFRQDSARKSLAFLQNRDSSLRKLTAKRIFASNYVLKETENLCKKASFLQSFDNDYTLLWCNHFWQRDSFFTMEHISKCSFCFCYTTHFFIPITKILSEQNARDWRHKAMQRCHTLAFYKNQNRVSLSIHQIKFNSVEGYTPLRVGGGTFGVCKAKLCIPFSSLSFLRFTLYALRFTLRFTNPKGLYSEGCANPSGLQCEALHHPMGSLSFTNPVGSLSFAPHRVSLQIRRICIPSEYVACKNFVFAPRSFASPFGFVKRNRFAVHPLMQTKSKNRGYFVCSLKIYEQVCVQGHNKSDRAEAILFNLIRGAGMNGVSTLQWKHAFFLCNSTHKFYPVYFGYKKENVDTSKLVFFCRIK